MTIDGSAPGMPHLHEDAELSICEFLPAHCEFFNQRPILLAKALRIPVQMVWDKAQASQSTARREIAERKCREMGFEEVVIQPLGKDVLALAEDASDRIFSDVVKKIPARVLKRIGILPPHDDSFTFPSVKMMREILIHGVKDLREDTSWVSRLTEQELKTLFHHLLNAGNFSLLKAFLDNPRVRGFNLDVLGPQLLYRLDEGDDACVMWLLDQPCIQTLLQDRNFNFDRAICFAVQRSNLSILEKLLMHPRAIHLSTAVVDKMIRSIDHFETRGSLAEKREMLSVIMKNPNFWQLDPSIACYVLENALLNKTLLEEITALLAPTQWALLDAEQKKDILHILYKHNCFELLREKVLTDQGQFLEPHDRRIFVEIMENPVCLGLRNALITHNHAEVVRIKDHPIFDAEPKILFLLMANYFEHSSDECLCPLIQHPAFQRDALSLDEYKNLVNAAKRRPSLLVLEKLTAFPLFFQCEKGFALGVMDPEFFGHAIYDQIHQLHPSIIQRICLNTSFLDDARHVFQAIDFLAKKEEYQELVKSLIHDPRFINLGKKTLMSVLNSISLDPVYQEQRAIIETKLLADS